MSKVIEIKKGLTINLKGKPERIFHQMPYPQKVALKPADFVGLTPKLMVAEGDKVLAGDPLFYDKNNPDIVFTSPASGVVESIVRGERRRILEVVVATDEKNEYKQFSVPSAQTAKREDIISSLVESGLWPCIKQRPFGCVANPKDTPKAIFISTFDTAPLAPDYTFLISEYKKDFVAGVAALKKLTEGKTYLNLFHEIRANNPFVGIEGVEYVNFSGKHPAGNVGVQIHHIDPINKGDVVWTVSPQEVVLIGRFLEKGVYDAKKIVALTGNVKKPYYYKTLLGAQASPILENQIPSEKQRFISGNVLTGSKIESDGFVGFFDSQITVIDEGDAPEFLGWLAPGLKKFSFSRAFFSWLQPEKEYRLHTNLNGGPRPFVFTGQYEKVLPMDIYPVQLIKSIIINDIDKMEQLGIYEVIEEDFALCEFVCPSKTEMQSLIREGIQVIQKEFS